MKSKDQLIKEFKKEITGLKDHSEIVTNSKKYFQFSKKEEELLKGAIRIVDSAKVKFSEDLIKKQEELQLAKIQMAISDIKFMKEIHKKVNA